MPFTTSRSSFRALPDVCGGSNGRRRSPAASLTSCRRRIPHLQAGIDWQHKSPPLNLPIEDRP
jgi:hypothetical protein